MAAISLFSAQVFAGISKEALAQMNMQDFVEATKTQKSGGMGYGVGLR